MLMATGFGRAWVWVMPLAVLFGCAEPQAAYDSSRPSADVIDLRMGYRDAFEAVVKTLEREGFKIDMADDRVGLIRTAPKAREGTEGGVTYQTVVIVRMGGTDRESWLAVDYVAMPSFPEEERKTRELLKGLAP